MSTGTTPAISLATRPKRTVPRYKLTIPLALTVLRSGVPDSVPGTTLEIGEGGMGVVATSQLLLGESVRVEFLLPHTNLPVRATAVVRYQRERCFGLQFLRLSAEQQSIIRYWTRCEGELLLTAPEPAAAPAPATSGEAAAEPALLAGFESSAVPSPRFRIRHVAALAVPLILAAALLGWWRWRWQQEWTTLKAQAATPHETVAKPPVQVPAEAMQQRIRSQITPEYPEQARQAKLQGTVVLDVVINEEGAVTQVNSISGPAALSLAATDAVRWWRYEPYLVNGQPATVETTVALDFRLSN